MVGTNSKQQHLAVQSSVFKVDLSLRFGLVSVCRVCSRVRLLVNHACRSLDRVTGTTKVQQRA